jgi:hypothetical protein
MTGDNGAKFRTCFRPEESLKGRSASDMGDFYRHSHDGSKPDETDDSLDGRFVRITAICYPDLRCDAKNASFELEV